MTWGTPKSSNIMTAYPRSVSWMGVSVGGMAFFLMLASWILVSYPIGSTVRGYFYGVENSEKVDLFSSLGNQSTRDTNVGDNVDMVGKILASESNSQVLMSTNKAPAVSESKEMKDVEAPVSTSSVRSNAPLMENNTQVIDKNLSQVPLSSTGQPVTPVPESSSALTKEENAKPSSDSPNATKDVEIKEPVFLSVNTSNSMDMGSNDATASSSDSNSVDMGSNDSGCLNVLFRFGSSITLFFLLRIYHLLYFCGFPFMEYICFGIRYQIISMKYNLLLLFALSDSYS